MQIAIQTAQLLSLFIFDIEISLVLGVCFLRAVVNFEKANIGFNLDWLKVYRRYKMQYSVALCLQIYCLIWESEWIIDVFGIAFCHGKNFLSELFYTEYFVEKVDKRNIHSAARIAHYSCLKFIRIPNLERFLFYSSTFLTFKNIDLEYFSRIIYCLRYSAL